MRIVKEEAVRSVKEDFRRGRTEECCDQMMSRQLGNVACLCGHLKGLRSLMTKDTQEPLYVEIGAVIDALEEILYEKSADWVGAQVRRTTKKPFLFYQKKGGFVKWQLRLISWKLKM